jgi:hypothetical protein
LDGNGDGEPGDDAVIRFGRGATLKYFQADGDSVVLSVTGGSQIDLVHTNSHELPRLRVVGLISPSSEIIGKVRRRAGGDGVAAVDVITPEPVRIQLPGRFALRRSVVASVVDHLLETFESPRELMLGDFRHA